ncbi:MAG: hypothetical protein AAF517_18595 [Planctomycetota bacterium]
MMTTRIHWVFGLVSTTVVVGAVAWGIVVVGTPSAARVERFDRQRLADLRTIFREVQSICQDPDIKDRLKRPLPATLDELSVLARSERINLSDPETGERYIYVVKDATTYQLCATFATERDSDRSVYWNHNPGRQCFSIDALDPPGK